LNLVLIANRLVAFDNRLGKPVKDGRRNRADIGLPDPAFLDLAKNPVDQVLGMPLGKSGLSGPAGRLLIRLQPALNPGRYRPLRPIGSPGHGPSQIWRNVGFGAIFVLSHPYCPKLKP
jgi:hypothetical protein